MKIKTHCETFILEMIEGGVFGKEILTRCIDLYGLIMHFN